MSQILICFMIIGLTGAAALYQARARIWISGDYVEWRKVVQHGHFSVAEVKDARYDPLQPFFVVGGDENRRLLRLHTSVWSPSALEELRSYIKSMG